MSIGFEQADSSYAPTERVPVAHIISKGAVLHYEASLSDPDGSTFGSEIVIKGRVGNSDGPAAQDSATPSAIGIVMAESAVGHLEPCRFLIIYGTSAMAAVAEEIYAPGGGYTFVVNRPAQHLCSLL